MVSNDVVLYKFDRSQCSSYGFIIFIAILFVIIFFIKYLFVN